MRATAIDLERLLVCPACQGPLAWHGPEALCAACGEAYPVVDGIPFMVAGAERARAGKGEFDAIAHIYDRTLPQHVTEHYLDQREKFLSQRLAGSPVLDVGGGTGALARRLLARGYEVLGADSSLGMLRVYHSRTSTIPVGALAHALPFPSESFQGVVSVALLHHIARPDVVRASLGEMYRVLRGGGALVVWDHNPANPYWPVIMKKVPQDSGQERLIPLQEICLGLRQAGATSLEVFRKGFVPDFVPPFLLPALQGLERTLEGTPWVRRWAAHNVVVVRKE